MHTDPKDPHGQDLNHIIDRLGIGEHRQVLLSTQKVGLDKMSTFYNLADVTINISDAEGFGLATLESLACGTPIIVNKTGGLQEQVQRGKNKFGIAIEPTSKAVIGSQSVPYIYEDRISQKDFNRALLKMYKMPTVKRREMGMNGYKHVMKHYNFENFQKTWVDYMLKIHEEEGSWETEPDTLTLHLRR